MKRGVINSLEILICESAQAASNTVAQMIADQVQAKPDCVLGLATGGTPVAAYERLIELNRQGIVHFNQVTTFNLDEYIGLDGDHPQSFRFFMNQKLFDQIDIDKHRTHVPDGRPADIADHCRQYESMIETAGGIDLQLLGLGHNGHIAFNEPGSPVTSRTRQVDLTSETIEMNSRFFDSIDEVPRHAITMGIATILEARRIVLLALGSAKASAIERMLKGPVDSAHPASLLRNHPNVSVVVDEPAAELIAGEVG